MIAELYAALLQVAPAQSFWFDEERGRPALILEEVPVFLPSPRRDGACPLTLRSETRAAVANFKESVVNALHPAAPKGVSGRRLRHHEQLLARAGHVPTQKQAEEAGPLALV